MKLSIWRTLLCAVLLLVSTSAPVPAQSASPEAIVDSLVRAWNTHDAKAWANHFTEDAVWVTVAEARAAGRSTIERDFAEAHSTWAKSTSAAPSDVEVRRPSADIAVVLFRIGFLSEDGKLIENSKRALLVVAVKQAGGWRITAGQLAHPSPSPS